MSASGEGSPPVSSEDRLSWESCSSKPTPGPLEQPCGCRTPGNNRTWRFGREAFQGKKLAFPGPPEGQVWAGLGAKPGRKVAQSRHHGAQTLGPGTDPGPPPPGKPPLQTRVLVGPWQPLPPPPPRQVDLICLQTPCVQWQVEKSLSGRLFLAASSEVALWGLRSTRPRGPHIWQSPKRAGHSPGSFCFIEKSQGGVGWGRCKAQAWLRVGLALELVPQVWRGGLSAVTASVRL